MKNVPSVKGQGRMERRYGGHGAKFLKKNGVGVDQGKSTETFSHQRGAGGKKRAARKKLH